MVDSEQMGCDCPRDVGEVDVVAFAVGDPSSGVVLRHGKYRSRRICEICIERCMYSMRYIVGMGRGDQLLICYRYDARQAVTIAPRDYEYLSKSRAQGTADCQEGVDGVAVVV